MLYLLETQSPAGRCCQITLEHSPAVSQSAPHGVHGTHPSCIRSAVSIVCLLRVATNCQVLVFADVEAETSGMLSCNCNVQWQRRL